jgi:DNA-binding transcriptional ArsR family regulator
LMLRLGSALAQPECCVCDLAAVVTMGELIVLPPLRVPRSHPLVKSHRQGRKAYDSLADRHIMNLYCAVTEHLDE